jgi:hypothetical protein
MSTNFRFPFEGGADAFEILRRIELAERTPFVDEDEAALTGLGI